MREIKIISAEKYLKMGSSIPSKYNVIVEDNIILKGFFDKRSKILKNLKNVIVYKERPKARLYYYDRITKKKINIKMNESTIFVGELTLKMPSIIEKNGLFYVSKDKTDHLNGYKD